jgi:pyridoxamine 5'-phosphate oxidase
MSICSHRIAAICWCNNPVMQDLPDFYNDLPLTEAKAWDLLQQASIQRKSPLHNLVVSTVDEAGWPVARTMVLREARRGHLRFHTDLRSPKAAQLAKPARVSVIGYHPGAKVQLRLRGLAVVRSDGEEADAAWEATTLFGRRCYLSEGPPGRTVNQPSSGLPTWVEGREPTRIETMPGRSRFGILTIAVNQLDFLYLAQAGHRRAVFHYTDETYDGFWCLP